MTLETDLRSIQITSGSTSTITVSGLSFAPKLLLLEWTRMNTTGTATGSDLEQGFGCVGSTGQWCSVLGVRDNRTSTSQAGSCVHGTSAIVSLGTGGGTIDGRLTFALTSDGYTATVDDSTGVSFLVDVAALGGTGIDAVVGERALPSGAGNFSTTVTGITPNFLIVGFGGNRHSAANSYHSTGGGWTGRGMAKSSSNRQCIVVGEDNGASTTQGRSRVDTGMLARFYNGATLEASVDFVSFAADTFTCNLSGSEVSRNPRMGYAAIRVDQSWLGTFATQTGTGNFSSTAPGFQGKMLLLEARNDATATEGSQYTAANANDLARGMALSSSSRVAHWHHSEGGIVLGNSESYNARQTTRVLMDYDRTGANTLSLIGDVDFVSWDATGFTLNQNDADAQATLVLAAVFGETAGGGGSGGTLVGGGLVASNKSGLVRAA